MNTKKKKMRKKNKKQRVLNYENVQFWCPNCREETIDKRYLDYYGGICQKCGYDFHTGWIFP